MTERSSDVNWHRAYLALLLCCLCWHAWALVVAYQRGPAPAPGNPHRGPERGALSAPAATQGRPGWKYEFRAPELLSGSVPAPQGLTFADTNTLLLGAHGGGVTALYRVDLVTRQVTARAESRTLTHLNSLRTRGNGEVWAAVQLPARGENVLMRLDLEASFASGEIQGTELRSFGNWGFSVAFTEAQGIAYALVQQWAQSSDPRLLVFRADDLSQPIKQLDLGLRIQDVTAHEGILYASRNTAQNGSSGGWLESYRMVDVLSAPDGSRLSPTGRTRHATRCAEGIAVRPGDGRLWAATEGLNSGDDPRYPAAIWSFTPVVPAT